ncbi:MAG: histone deacetylase [Gemmatimonadetes bacterium]|nr:histone deacetylase [Gemmatimonadota bacterium]NNM06263.1 histone deacetylase [Gemmatimonadota bacterium]
MRLFYCDHFVLPLPREHRFPMEKYRLLRMGVETLLDETGGDLCVPDAATDAELGTVHDEEYLRRVREGSLSTSEIRRIGFPWSHALVERSRRSVGGTLSAARAAVQDGLSVNLSGGTHHAFPDRGEGFCVFNDVAVAARVLCREGVVQRCVVLDLDVHQGNGTAFIFRDDPTVFTLSVHGANNYPFRKEPGDLDMELPDGAGDRDFLDIAMDGVRSALSASAFDLAFFIAGADPFEGDRLGRVSVSKEALQERDRFVFAACRKAGIPLAVVMGGGYATDINDTVDIHVNTVRQAADSIRR